jgi:DnaJ-class molecular chaperone
MPREPTLTMNMPCPTCGGEGHTPMPPPPSGGAWMPGSQPPTCPNCNGSGTFPRDVTLTELRSLLDAQ